VIYIGYHKEGLPLADDQFPELAVMCEAEMMEWGREHWKELYGFFVNRSYLLYFVHANMLQVVRKDGSQFRLIDHPRWAEHQNSSVSGIEFYTSLPASELHEASGTIPFNAPCATQ
jgi:hypothetical protein